MSPLEFAKEIEKAIKANKPIETDDSHFFLKNKLLKTMLDFPETPKDFNVYLKKRPLYDVTVLVSGGADSTIMWDLVNNSKISDYSNKKKKALYVNLGHSYADKEIEAIKKFNIDFELIDYPLSFDSFWKHIIPTRNFILLSLAEEQTAAEGEIWIGAVQGESANDSGDKSELFFRLFEEYVWRTKRKKVTVRTLKHMTKNDLLKKHWTSNQDPKIFETITCFDGTTKKPCGRCQACVRKWISLLYCGISDKQVEDMFEINPYVGGKEHIKKYKDAMSKALEIEDYTHYSKDRCLQDLKVIQEYEKRNNN